MSDKLGDIHPLDVPDSISNIRRRSALDEKGYPRERRNVSEDAFSGYQKITDPEAMHIMSEDRENADAEEVSTEEIFDSGEKDNRKKGRELWKQENVILQTKTAVFDKNSKLQKLINPLFNDFIKEKYDVETKDEAMKMVGSKDLGKSTSEYLIANDFLHYLKDNKRWDVVKQIEKKSATVKVPEMKIKEKGATDSLDLKLNRRRIESHLEPDIIKHVDRFVAVYGSGAVTKVMVDTKKGAVSAIKLFYNRNDGVKSVFLTREMFHDAFDGVNYYRDSRNSDPTGLSFIDNDGDMLVLNSETTDSEAKEIFSQLSIDGKKITGDFEVVVNRP